MTATSLARAAGPASSPSRRNRIRKGSDWPTRLVVVVIVGILGLLIIYPLVAVFGKAFSADGRATLVSMVTSSSNLTIILNTIWLGTLVGALGTALGFLMAYLQVKVKFRGKKILHLLCLLPVVSPPFAVATAVITLLGRRGIITWGIFGVQTNIYGLPGLTIVLVLSFFPVAYMNFKGMLEALDPALDEASANLGGNRWNTFWRVTIPMLIPGFASSFLLLFVESIADLANPLVLGGDYNVLASRAYVAITGEYNIAAGSAYSIVLLFPAVVVFLVQRYWVARKSVVSVTGKPAGNPKLLDQGFGRISLITFGIVVGLIVSGIYLAVLFGAFVSLLGVNNQFTLVNFKYVLSGIGKEPITDTTVLALIATPISGILGMTIGWLVVRKLRKWSGALDFLGMLGLAVPGTVVGIGYAIAFNQPYIVGNRMLLPALGGGAAAFGGAMAIIMVYIIRSIPAGQRAGIAALQQIDPSIDEAAASLGASSTTTFRTVTLPLIRPALLSGLTYAFARSMTTLSPIIFITTSQTQIMTKQILAEVDAGRYGNAFAFCTLLLFIVAVVVGLMNLFIGKNRRAELRGVV